MTILVSQATAQAYANASSVTTGALTTVDNSLIVIAAGAYNGGGLAGVTRTPSDSKSNTWSVATDLIGDLQTLTGLYYNLNGTRGASHTFTFGLDTTTQMSAVGIEITGSALSAVLDQSASDSQITGTSTVTTGVTANAINLVIGVAMMRNVIGECNWAANGTITGSDGTDIILDNNVADAHGAGIAVWYRRVTATGAQTASRTHATVTADWTASVAAFTEAAGSTDVPVLSINPQLSRRRRYF